MSTTQPFALGRVHSTDEGDKNYRLATLMGMIPAKKRTTPWRGGSLLNQGSISQCVGATGREFLTSSPVPYRKPSPSMEESYAGAQRFDEWAGTPHDGSSARGLFKFYQSIGLVSSYYWTKDATETAAYVEAYGPIALGIPWDYSCFTPDSAGVIHPDGNEAGGHEVLLDWFFAKRRLFLCRNHWVNRDGTPWGNVKGHPGHFLISADDLSSLIQRGGDMCAATESPLA